MGKGKQIEGEGSTEEKNDENMAFDKHDEVDREHNEVNPEHQDIIDGMPSGYRFRPTEEELIMQYLKNKASNLTLPANRIRDVMNLYNFHPQQLWNMHHIDGQKKSYFFTLITPYHHASNADWQFIGPLTYVSSNGLKVGTKSKWVYFGGSYEDGETGDGTDWLMDEYEYIATEAADYDDNYDGDWVLCVLYHEGDITEEESSTESTQSDSPPSSESSETMPRMKRPKMI